MGCDFWWTGAIPRQDDQVRAVEMFVAIFDYHGDWPVIAPDPANRLPTLISATVLSDPVHHDGANNFLARIKALTVTTPL